MKIFHFFLLFVVLALASVMADDDDDSQALCKSTCFQNSYEPVCAKFQGKAQTYYNECETICENAEVIHGGDCEHKDLLNNKLER